MQPVDRTSPLPVYFQIATDLRRRLSDGEWNEGTRMTPEHTLAGEYDVSRVTIRQALAELVKDDLIERHRGSGTYVRNRPRPFVFDLTFTLATLAAKLKESGFKNRAEVLDARIVKDPPTDLRHRLQLTPTGRVVYMLRRIIINDEPAALSRSWLDAARVPGLEKSPRLTGSLSAMLAERYGLSPVRADNQIEVIRSTREEAALLGTPADIPLLAVTATTYLADGKPLEHSRVEWLGDRVRFHVTAYAEEH